jgi:hypothetical protein
MSSLEAFLSDTPKARRMRGTDLANKKNEVLDVEKCDPKTLHQVWPNEVWHCQRESQNVSLGYLDKKQVFRVRAIGCERHHIER